MKIFLNLCLVKTGHISLSELQAQVAHALEAAFPMPVWVAAEVADVRVNAGSGHCYFELVEKGDNSIPKASVRAVAWRGTWASLGAYFRGITGDELAPGMRVLLKVTVSYHELYGLSLVITDIDPSYTLGDRERARQQAIAQLKADGVWDMNREVEFADVIQRVAVVSSPGAAGWRDFVQELGRFPWRFEVTLFEAVMQGTATEGSVVAALEAIAARADEFDVAENASVHLFVTGDGQHVEARRTCDHYADGCGSAPPNTVGDLDGEGRIASSVGRGVDTVHEDVGHTCRAADPQEYPAALPRGGYIYAFKIVGYTGGWLGVGKVDDCRSVGRGLVGREKSPARTDVVDFASRRICRDGR